jgi:hypothetical protein
MRACLVLLSLGLAAGCGSDPGPEPITPAQAEDLCTQSCSFDVECDAKDLASCVTDCVTDVGTWARHDAIATIADCRDSLTCDDDTDACLERVKPLAYHRAFETRCREALVDCVGIIIETDCAVEYNVESDDIGFFRFMSEPVIRDLTTCMDAADCDARLTCIDDVFVARNINL